MHRDGLSPNEIYKGDILSPNKIYQGDILSPNRGRHKYKKSKLEWEYGTPCINIKTNINNYEYLSINMNIYQ